MRGGLPPAACVLRLEVYVGQSVNSPQLTVVPLQQEVKKFVEFKPMGQKESAQAKVGRGILKMKLKERPARVAMWVANSFNIQEDLSSVSTIDLYFRSVSSREVLRLFFNPETSPSLSIYSDSMETAGHIVQDMCQFIGLSDLGSEANYPDEMETFQEVLTNVQSLTDQSQGQTASLGQEITNLKALMVGVEDARQMSNMALMRENLAELRTVNSQLIAQSGVKANQASLLKTELRKVKAMINKAGNLRCKLF